MLGVLYDIHGNLPALEAVIAEARRAGASRWLLGGDYVVFGAWPRETLERLGELEEAAWIRGNTDRWLVDDGDYPGEAAPLLWARGRLDPGQVEELFTLPARVGISGVLYCHASPLSDMESFAPQPEPGEERLLDGERRRTIFFGHTHRQFRRAGPNETDLVNPGSVGMPLDGDRRAAWALVHDDGTIELRRTEYDVARSAAALRGLGSEWAERIARRLERAELE